MRERNCWRLEHRVDWQGLKHGGGLRRHLSAPFVRLHTVKLDQHQTDEWRLLTVAPPEGQTS